MCWQFLFDKMTKKIKSSLFDLTIKYDQPNIILPLTDLVSYINDFSLVRLLIQFLGHNPLTDIVKYCAIFIFDIV